MAAPSQSVALLIVPSHTRSIVGGTFILRVPDGDSVFMP